MFLQLLFSFRVLLLYVWTITQRSVPRNNFRKLFLRCLQVIDRQSLRPTSQSSVLPRRTRFSLALDLPKRHCRSILRFHPPIVIQRSVSRNDVSSRTLPSLTVCYPILPRKNIRGKNLRLTAEATRVGRPVKFEVRSEN